MKLARQTGFPEIWDDRISNKERFLYPALLGFALVIIEILVSLAMHLPDIHVAFPLSIPVYLTDGIFLEILDHLIPVVFLVWLIFNVIQKGKRQKKFLQLLPSWQVYGSQQCR